MRTPSQSFKRPPGPAKTLLCWVQNFILLAGLVTLGWCVYVQAETFFFQTYQSWRLDRLQQGKPASVTLFVKQWLTIPWQKGAPSNSPNVSLGRKGSSPKSSRNFAPHGEGDLIGKLAIPRLNLSAIVLEGTDAHTLRLAVGHLPGTPLPGEPGSVDLAAHRDTFFSRLHNIHRGDVVTMSTVSGVNYLYRVGTMAVVSPDNTSILNSSPQPGINLITCYPFNYVGAAPERFVVHADQVSASARPLEPHALLDGTDRGMPHQSSSVLAASLTQSPSFATRPATKSLRHSTKSRQKRNSLAEVDAKDDSTGGEEASSTPAGTLPPGTGPKRAAKTPPSHTNPLRAFFRKLFKPSR